MSNKQHEIVVLPGDGIGPEIARATVAVLDKVDQAFDLGLAVEEHTVGLASHAATGTTLPDSVWQRIQAVEAIVLGPLSTYNYPAREAGGINVSSECRTRLDLYANVRPSLSMGPAAASGERTDLIVVRENTEGFYASRAMYQGSGEFMPDPDSAFALRKITRRASFRVVTAALELARHRRRKLTVVHKGNVLKLSDGLFLAAAREAAANYPDIEIEELLVDAAASLLVRAPQQYDVMVTTNMFGDILSNIVAEVTGGLALAPSLNSGEGRAMAQASHGSAPDIANQDRANPSGLILSAAMLLDWLGARHGRSNLLEAGERIRKVVRQALSRPETATADVGGRLGTRDFTQVLVGMI